jgi:nitrite reductase/ring-hydroxylating ferredoxin subunit
MAWHTVDISPDSRVFAVRIAGWDVLMIDTEAGWLAVEDRCSHADCSFSADGEVDGSTVICNCHGSEFDLRTGDVLVPPAFDPIRTFPVRSTDGRLEVEL